MKHLPVLPVRLAGLAAAFLSASCMRQSHRTVEIQVPEMQSARDVRIVTNAALNEVVGRSGVQHAYEIGLERGLLLYHEGPRLLSMEYQRHIERCLRDIGYEARVLTVRHQPAPPMPTPSGWLQAWPDRHIAAISIPAMKTGTDAHVVLGAMAYARTGDDPAHVRPDPEGRTLLVTYNARLMALKNIEGAIACAGFRANDTPARLGQGDSPPIGWTPVGLY